MIAERGVFSPKIGWSFISKMPEKWTIKSDQKFIHFYIVWPRPQRIEWVKWWKSGWSEEWWSMRNFRAEKWRSDGWGEKDGKGVIRQEWMNKIGRDDQKDRRGKGWDWRENERKEKEGNKGTREEARRVIMENTWKLGRKIIREWPIREVMPSCKKFPRSNAWTA